MTTRPFRSLLAASALVLQVLMGLGATRGVVLCVGSAGHVAFEGYEAASRCREADNGLAADAFTGSSEAGAPPACVDTPLLEAGSERSTSPLRFAPAVVAEAPAALLPRRVELVGRAAWMLGAPRDARILRSVILLI